MLYRPGAWRVRASSARGFYAPTPFVERIEEAGLAGLEPLDRLRAETARTASLDLAYRRGTAEASVDLFASDIDGATRPETVDSDRVRLVNLTGGVVAMWEDHDRGRLGIEAYYTGRQQLEDNPFRSIGRPYVIWSFLAKWSPARPGCSSTPRTS